MLHTKCRLETDRHRLHTKCKLETDRHRLHTQSISLRQTDIVGFVTIYKNKARHLKMPVPMLGKDIAIYPAHVKLIQSVLSTIFLFQKERLFCGSLCHYCSEGRAHVHVLCVSG